MRLSCLRGSWGVLAARHLQSCPQAATNQADEDFCANKSSALIWRASDWLNTELPASILNGSSQSRITWINPSAYLNVAASSCRMLIVSISYTYSETDFSSTASNWKVSPARCELSATNWDASYSFWVLSVCVRSPFGGATMPLKTKNFSTSGLWQGWTYFQEWLMICLQGGPRS